MGEVVLYETLPSLIMDGFKKLSKICVSYVEIPFHRVM